MEQPPFTGEPTRVEGVTIANLPNGAADTAVLGCLSLAQPLETEVNGRLKRDVNGKTAFSKSTRNSTSGFTCSWTVRSSSRTKPGNCASIASSSNIGSSNETSGAVVAVAVPFQSTVQLPFPENGASPLGTLDRRVPQVADREMCFGLRCGA